MPQVETVDDDPSDERTAAIPSILPPGENPKQHFVTARGTGEIVLRVTFSGLNDGHQVSCEVETAESTFTPVAENLFVVRISRANQGRFGARMLVDGAILWDGLVWVVWSEINRIPNPITIAKSQTKALPLNGVVPGGRLYSDGVQLFTRPKHYFTFTVYPTEIANDTDLSDIPDLRGPNTVHTAYCDAESSPRNEWTTIDWWC